MDVVEYLRQQIARAKDFEKQGYDCLEPENVRVVLEAAVSALELGATREEQTVSRAIMLEQHKHRAAIYRDERREMIKAVITQGQSALKAALLINGLAAVAVLAFAGSLVGATISGVPRELMADALLVFCLGTLASAIAFGSTYLSTLFGTRETEMGVRLNLALLVVTIGITLGAYAFFFAGGLLMRIVFLK